MCDSCSHGGNSGGRRTSTLLIVGALIATLAAVAIAGVATHAGSAHQTAPCSTVGKASADYAAAITRDLRAGTKVLLADTDAFTTRIRANTSCQRTGAVVRSVHATLIGICSPCVDRLDRGAN